MFFIKAVAITAHDIATLSAAVRVAGVQALATTAT